MAPDSARTCSFGSSVIRAAANDGLCRTSTFIATEAIHPGSPVGRARGVLPSGA
jgi:hypothetical protein